nr:tigger transposable element-derived protein 1-like [Onthophagus taurus]
MLKKIQSKRIPIDGKHIKEKALRIYNQLQELEPPTSLQATKKLALNASEGWLTGFIKRHAFHNVKIKGEVASADENAAKTFPDKLAKIVEEGGHTPEQIFNADETGLFWKKMPERTYIAKSEKLAGGFKAAKVRVTLLLCSNASGDKMLKLLLINKFLMPRALRSKNIKQLSVHFMANKKAWMTADLFTNWFNNCFVPEVQ